MKYSFQTTRCCFSIVVVNALMENHIGEKNCSVNDDSFNTSYNDEALRGVFLFKLI